MLLPYFVLIFISTFYALLFRYHVGRFFDGPVSEIYDDLVAMMYYLMDKLYMDRCCIFLPLS